MPITLQFHTDDGAAEVQYPIDSQWMGKKCAYPRVHNKAESPPLLCPIIFPLGSYHQPIS